MKKYEKRSNNLYSKQHVDSNVKKWLYITFVLFSNFGDGYSYSTHKLLRSPRLGGKMLLFPTSFFSFQENIYKRNNEAPLQNFSLLHSYVKESNVQ